jgi:uncharacterized membrane protein HdeD (DUF308 family)
MLEALSAVVVLVGLVLLVVGAIYFLIVAFQESLLWGLAVLFLPGIVSFIFLIVEWPAAKRPFFWQLWGILLIIGGIAMASGHLPYEQHHHLYLR